MERFKRIGNWIKGKTPHAEPLVVPNENHFFDLNEEGLAHVLMHDDLKDHYVVVVSIAGAFREGKSFMLNFFLQYLNSKYDIKESVPNWLRSQRTTLNGFSSKGGSERITTGILMWSNIFTTKVNEEKIAIILLDTQGMWDDKSVVKETSTIFALSTMLSSVQIYNISTNIREDHLQQLQLFAEYGKIALKEYSMAKPFQKLVFLVRDWQWPDEDPYGIEGGQQLLKKRLQIDENQHEELRSLRVHINSCFEELNCFLLPHPGKTVSINSNENLSIDIKDIDEEFIDHVETFVPMILAPENLILKQINGEKITVQDFVNYCKIFIDIFKNNEMPEPKSMYQGIAEASHRAAVEKANNYYRKTMEKIRGSPEMFDIEHETIKLKAIDIFWSKKKMGNEQFSQSYLEKLEMDIDQYYLHLSEINKERYDGENRNLQIVREGRRHETVIAALNVAAGVFRMMAVVGLGFLLRWR